MQPLQRPHVDHAGKGEVSEQRARRTVDHVDVAHRPGKEHRPVAIALGVPAVALGAYDATPLDMAGAYTVFANGGTRVSPMMVKSVRNSKGDMLQDFEAD